MFNIVLNVWNNTMSLNVFNQNKWTNVTIVANRGKRHASIIIIIIVFKTTNCGFCVNGEKNGMALTKTQIDISICIICDSQYRKSAGWGHNMRNIKAELNAVSIAVFDDLHTGVSFNIWVSVIARLDITTETKGKRNLGKLKLKVKRKLGYNLFPHFLNITHRKYWWSQKQLCDISRAVFTS